LWQVNDKSTSELMGRFYAAYKAGVPKDEALRGAQLAMLREARAEAEDGSSPSYAAPFYWAAFEIVGDWQ
jgi:CHAT domain-containing protein